MTNRTKKVAETIAKSLNEYEVTFAPFSLDAKRFIDKIKQLDKVEHNDFSKFAEKLDALDAYTYDLLVFGSPNYGNMAPKTVQEIIKRVKNLDGKNVAIYVTGRFNGDKALVTMKEMIEEKGAQIVAEKCFSRFFRIRKTDGIELVNQIL
jgi:flavodoxin